MHGAKWCDLWYQQRVRATLAAVALVLSACGTVGPGPDSSSGSPAAAIRVEPAMIDRVRAELPDGYELAPTGGWIPPAAVWGFGGPWSAEPAACGELADPAVATPASRGWSGSGPGGIVYATVAASPRSAAPDPAVLADCARWTLAGGQTDARITATAPPQIDGATTVAMAIATSTVVEGGTQTHSQADTVTAYLTDHVASVTVVTDPGSPSPQLGQQFAAELMVETVAALRS